MTVAVTSRVSWSADIRLGDGSLFDLTPFLIPIEEGGLGSFRQNLNPISREVDLSIGTLVADNSNGRFKPGSGPDAIFSQYAYAGLRVRLLISYTDENGRVFGPSVVWTGFIDNIEWDDDNLRASFKVYDALERVRIPDVQPANEGVLFSASDSPAHTVLKILKTPYAGLPVEFIDTASFETAHTSENGAGLLMKNFKLSAGSYYSGIATALRHGGAGIFCTRAGKIQYLTFLPSLTAGSPRLSKDRHIITFSGYESNAGVRNTVRVKRGNGADPPVVTSPGTPIRTSVVLPGFVSRGAAEMTLQYFSGDTETYLIADRTIDLQSVPPGIYSCVCHLDEVTYLLELGQRISVDVPRFGFVNKGLTIIEANYVYGTSRVHLVLWDNAIETKPWLYTNNSQELDDDQLIY